MMRFILGTALAACAFVTASESTFSVNDDLFAYPQYEVDMKDDYIILDEAVRLLGRKASQNAEIEKSNDVSIPPESSSGPSADASLDDVDFEILTLHEQPYFCSIPIVTPSTSNETQAKATEAEIQQELARAADKGRELLAGMQGHQCLFYTTGWWTYSFCYNQAVRQFHALSLGQTGGRVWPPKEDPMTPAFVLGKVDDTTKDPAAPDQQPLDKVATELQTRSETSYLVQRLGSGTPCDLTGKDRKIEIEYHCNPQLTDRIGWIKETSTCSYLMVVYTPRLCSDVAFLPPKETKAHTITCRQILTEDQVPEWEAIKNEAEQASSKLIEQGSEQPLVVGDIEVGGMKYFKDGKKLERGRIVLTQDERAETIALQKDGKVSSMSKADLKKLDLNPADIEQFKKELEKLAGKKDWKIERLDDINGQIQLRGVVSDDEQAVEVKKEKGEKPALDDQKTPPKPEEEPPDTTGTAGDEGSEEEFKEDL